MVYLLLIIFNKRGKMTYLNLAAVKDCTQAEGPGKRFALWVQGCLKNCDGCCNKEMQAIKNAHIVETSDLERLILESKEKNNIEGVTFAGGEPAIQAVGLCEVAKFCRANELSVMMYTGYLYNELKEKNDPAINALLENVDLLIDGEFQKDKIDKKRDWIGSTNQKIWFLTNKYKDSDNLFKNEHQMDLTFENNTLKVNGWPFL